MSGLKKAVRPRVRLNSREINVVSVIAQNSSLPHSYLLDLAKNSELSPQALLVVRAMLSNTGKQLEGKTISTTNRAAKKVSASKKPAVKKKSKKTSAASDAANDFSRWASALR